MSTSPFPLSLSDRYAQEVPGATIPWRAAPASAPKLLVLNRSLAGELGIDAEALGTPLGAQWLSGNQLPDNIKPVALAYAGHQFGGFSPVLGDGRALLLGEFADSNGKLHDLHLKGSGKTPFARRGDGKATLGPMLREYMMGEAMHALGIPTTRALAVVSTGDTVAREKPLPGAIVARVASSHLRVGTFQYFAARGDLKGLGQLLDYAIDRHYPELRTHPHKALALLSAVSDRQARLVARWMAVGFVHGVMNTDNVTISGETIDYGPCAFLDAYDPQAVFSSIDQDGRYAFGNQPRITQWNLARFGEALLPLISGDEEVAVAEVSNIVEQFVDLFSRYHREEMAKKLGFLKFTGATDLELIRDFLDLLARNQIDYTMAFRTLTHEVETEAQSLRQFCAGDDAERWRAWFIRWRNRIGDGMAAARNLMIRANPAFIARNHKVEEALAAAVERNDLAPFELLLQILARPFDEQPEHVSTMEAPPRERQVCHRTFCGT